MVSPVDAAAEHPTCELLKGEGHEHEGSKHLDIRPSESGMLATDPA